MLKYKRSGMMQSGGFPGKSRESYPLAPAIFDPALQGIFSF